ncbi:hypothetical protein GNI_164160 [Gregarina niphandrodes]|uniref:Uncharacterized protein n=1 Tax=Gregarina niphandrodes TaxID=110365 RepID=A0A023AYA2_GRENI|nr:hypothetical protein GNI_164160 [Gregarina niphandrodes]EZG43636.1 hypothetical protein GNI_164160 [Gregarina niphandrodes]|eukprot:XP_011133139.1 hypothetical protein GNI_164160 [Gregarina niphandrodes]
MDGEGVRESALKLYTDVLTGLVQDRASAWNQLRFLISSLNAQNVEENDGVFNILADLCCEICYQDLCTGCPEELLVGLAQSPLAIQLGFCCSVIQRLSSEEVPSELGNVLCFLQRLLGSLATPDALLCSLSQDRSVCHTLEVLYREIYDLEERVPSAAVTLFAGSTLHPGVLLGRPEVVRLSQHPELTASMLLLGGALLPKCSTTEAQPSLPELMALVERFDWCSVTDETADIELVSAWFALMIQLIVRQVKAGQGGANTLDAEGYERLFYICLSALAINRLGMTAKVMTEPVDVGLLALSETHTTELTAMTSGIEALLCLLQEHLVPVVVKCFGTAAPETAEIRLVGDTNFVRRIVECSGIIETGLESVVTDWLVTDALCFMATNLRWYNVNVDFELSRGALRSYFVAQLDDVGRTINENVPSTENWIRAFLLSTLLRLLSADLSVDELLRLSQLLVSPAWWTPDSHQKRLQSAYVCCHLVEQLVSVQTVQVLSPDDQENTPTQPNVFEQFAARIAQDPALLQILIIVWTCKPPPSDPNFTSPPPPGFRFPS